MRLLRLNFSDNDWQARRLWLLAVPMCDGPVQFSSVQFAKINVVLSAEPAGWSSAGVVKSHPVWILQENSIDNVLACDDTATPRLYQHAHAPEVHALLVIYEDDIHQIVVGVHDGPVQRRPARPPRVHRKLRPLVYHHAGALPSISRHRTHSAPDAARGSCCDCGDGTN